MRPKYFHRFLWCYDEMTGRYFDVMRLKFGFGRTATAIAAAALRADTLLSWIWCHKDCSCASTSVESNTSREICFPHVDGSISCPRRRLRTANSPQPNELHSHSLLFDTSAHAALSGENPAHPFNRAHADGHQTPWIRASCRLHPKCDGQVPLHISSSGRLNELPRRHVYLG